jgi:hypothetical protein
VEEAVVTTTQPIVSPVKERVETSVKDEEEVADLDNVAVDESEIVSLLEPEHVEVSNHKFTKIAYLWRKEKIR